jgi:glycosyltransferase involved in cell wall biosynthesis
LAFKRNRGSALGSAMGYAAARNTLLARTLETVTLGGNAVKVLFNNHVPFMLAHGGAQIQIEQTMAGLREIGVEVEPLRWWDETQTGEVLHHFGRIPTSLLRSAHKNGMRVVFSDFLTEQGSRSTARLKFQKFLTRAMSRTLPGSLIAAHHWDSYLEADACLALTPLEAHIMADVFGAPPARIHVVANGVEKAFFVSQPAQRGPWLVCTATITERKRIVELEEAAIRAQTPVWVIGKPYSESDPYAQRFVALAKANPKFIRYEGAVQDRTKLAQIYREARGFVLLSAWESLSLSALEAVACQCPLLLSDLPWARTTFKDKASYCPATGSIESSAAALRRFYDAAPSLPLPPRPASWIDIAQQLKTVYAILLGKTRRFLDCEG